MLLNYNYKGKCYICNKEVGLRKGYIKKSLSKWKVAHINCIEWNK